jgi:hypothetical protein
MSAGLVTLGLSAAAPAAVRAVPQQAVPQQAGHFWPGDLLNMDNADFENGVGNWDAISNVKTLTTDSTSFLHSQALKIVASASPGTTPPFTSVLQLSGQDGIQINLPGTGTRKFRVGAYIEMPAENSHTTEFDLYCYESNGTSLGWYNGTPVTNQSDGNWHWVEDDISVPSGCAYVQDSPRVQFTGMHNGGTIHMDEVWFAPDRAALMIGAYAHGAANWVSDDTPGNSAYIGPLQSVKIFFGNGTPDLPGQWSGTVSSPNECYQIEQSIGSGPYPTCVINLNPVDPTTGDFTVYPESLIQSFLAGMPQQQTVIFIYHDEPEGDSFSGCGSASGDAANFVCYFEEEAASIRMAAAEDSLTENVFTADDSASSKYADVNNQPPGCTWIVPASSADFYFEDHYERGWANGSNLSAQNGDSSGQGAQEWNNWLGCVNTVDQPDYKPVGLAEYGLCSGGANCNNGSTNCNDSSGNPGGSTALDEQTMSADNTYLGGSPSGVSPTLLWEYWYNACWQFTNSNGGITEWQSIENQNGGSVGGL